MPGVPMLPAGPVPALSAMLSAPPIAAPPIAAPPIAGVGGLPGGGGFPPMPQGLSMPQPVARGPQPGMTPLSQTAQSGEQPKDTNPQDPLSWVLDILDRPRRAVADTLDSVVTGGIDAAAGIKDLVNGDFQKNGDAAKWQGDAFQMLPGVSAARGAFSTAHGDQLTTAQMIEKGVDQYGHNFDPHYKDTQDNVNPILKGALGVAGDIGSDPLTYLGIGEVAAAYKIGTAALKGGEGALKGGEAAKAVANHLGNYTGINAGIGLAKGTGGLVKRLVGGQKQVEDLVGKAALGDAKAGELLDQTTQTAADDAARAVVQEAGANEPTVTKVTTPVPAPLSAELAAKIGKVGAEGKMSPEMAQALVTPEVSQPITASGKVDVLTGNDAPLGGETPAVPKVEPKSLGDQFKGSATHQNFQDLREALANRASARSSDMLSALREMQQGSALNGIMGDGFAAALKNYRNPENFQRNLDEVDRLLRENHHFDDTDFGTKLTGARNMLKGMFADAGLGPKIVEQTQTARAAFKGHSTVAAEMANPTTVADIVERIRKSGPTPADSLAEHLNDSDLAELFKERADRIRVAPPRLKNTTGTGAKSSGERSLKKSTAQRIDEMNTHNQAYDIVGASDKGAAKLKMLDKVYGAKRASLLRGIVMGTSTKVGLLDGLARLRDHIGYTHWIDDGKNTPVAASAHQVLSLLGGGSAADQRLIDKLFFNPKTGVSKTNFLEAVAAAVHGASRDDIRGTLVKASKRYREDGSKPMPNFLSGGANEGVVDSKLVGPSDPLVLGPGERAVENVSEATKRLPKNVKSVNVVQSADSMADQATDLIMRRVDDLKSLARDNAADYARRTASEARELTQGAIDLTDQLRNDPRSLGDAIHAMYDKKGTVGAIADATGGAREDAKAIAVEVLDAVTPEVTKAGVAAAVKGAEHVAAGDHSAARAAVAEALKPVVEDTAQAAKEEFAQGVETGQLDGGAHYAEEGETDTPATEAALGSQAQHVPQYDIGKRTTGSRIKAVRDSVLGETVGHKVRSRQVAMLQAFVAPIMKEANATAGAYSFAGLHTAMASKITQVSTDFNGLIGQAEKVAKGLKDPQALHQVYQDIMLGQGSAPEHAELRGVMDQAAAFFMDPAVMHAKQILAEPNLRVGTGEKEVFLHLQKSGLIPPQYQWVEAAEGVTGTADTLLQTGRSGTGSIGRWLMDLGVPTGDPLTNMKKLFGATMTHMAHVAIAQQMLEDGKALGFLSDTFEKGKGFVELKNTSEEGKAGNLVFHHLTDGGKRTIYADHETAVAINRVVDMLNPQSRTSGEVAHILQMYDDALQLWKFGETAIRPGTRLHNFLSDHIMTWLDTGLQGYHRGQVNSYKMMLANRGEGALGRQEIIDHLVRLGKSVKDQNYGGATEVLFKGEHGSFTNEQAWRLFDKAGLRTSARAIERADKENLSGIGRFGVAFRNNPLVHKLDLLTETTENQVRAAHFSVLLQRALVTGRVDGTWGKSLRILDKDGNIDENLLAHALSNRVRRFHPDPHMLSNFERGPIRRVVPFYQWTRSALPAVLEATALHPGRVLAFNKLSYNVGVALGVDGNSLADPYPNGAWPGFLLSQMQGPQANINGSMFTMNPGIPTWDIANMFTDPNQINGSISPLLSFPLEVATGQNAQTHEPITNWYDAVDSQLPLVASAATFTGYSPTGSLIGALTGQGPLKTSQALQGQQDPVQHTLTPLSYMLGLNTTHVNKTSYQQAGIAQEQNRLSQIMSGMAPPFGR